MVAQGKVRGGGGLRFTHYIVCAILVTRQTKAIVQVVIHHHRRRKTGGHRSWSQRGRAQCWLSCRRILPRSWGSSKSRTCRGWGWTSPGGWGRTMDKLEIEVLETRASKQKMGSCQLVANGKNAVTSKCSRPTSIDPLFAICLIKPCKWGLPDLPVVVSVGRGHGRSRNVHGGLGLVLGVVQRKAVKILHVFNHRVDGGGLEGLEPGPILLEELGVAAVKHAVEEHNRQDWGDCNLEQERSFTNPSKQEWYSQIDLLSFWTSLNRDMRHPKAFDTDSGRQCGPAQPTF
jgi:hypothetical protein